MGCRVVVTSWDFSRPASLISRAEWSTGEWLRKGGLQFEDIPPSMIPHNNNDDSDPPYPTQPAAS